MKDWVLPVCEGAAAAVSLVLMGIFGTRLLARFIRVLRGRETADGLGESRQSAPGGELAAAALTALLSRLLVYVLAYAIYRLCGGAEGLFASLEPLWSHWDTRHYVGIAREGYTAMGDERLRLVFFPLYPVLMRALSLASGGSLFAGGVLVSLVCTTLSGALLYDLCYMHGGRGTARLALAYFLLSPLSVFLNCAYTEALFICLTLAAVCLLRRNHPWLAALFGMASAMTRMPGVIVAGLFIIALCAKIGERRAAFRDALACILQVLIVFTGLFVYWGVNWAVTGDPFTYLVYQRENWFQEPGSFWGSTANTMHYFLTSYGDGDWLYTWGFQMLCLLLIYYVTARYTHLLPFDLAAYGFVYICVVLSPTWLLSAPRYLYALCALPLLQARLPFSRRGHGMLLALSSALLMVWIYGYTIAVEVL